MKSLKPPHLEQRACAKHGTNSPAHTLFSMLMNFWGLDQLDSPQQTVKLQAHRSKSGHPGPQFDLLMEFGSKASSADSRA